MSGVELEAHVPQHVDLGKDGGMECICEWGRA